MSIHIVTHVYAETLPQYAVFLRAQLSSLYIRRKDPELDRVTVCYYDKDAAVVEVLKDFVNTGSFPQLHQMPMPKEELFQRSIGRNRAGLKTKADLVWYTDVDHYFGVDCLHSLDRIWNSFTTKPVMIWPKKILIHSNHALGDLYWRDEKENRFGIFMGIGNALDYVDKTYDRAIGGVQIVSGDFSRKHGYLNSQPKWLQPLSPGSKPFPSFQDDVKFRQHCKSMGISCAVDLPGLYRFRHSETTYQ